MSDKIPVGRCDTHGIVVKDDLNYNFPNPAVCDICGEAVETVTMATEDEIEKART